MTMFDDFVGISFFVGRKRPEVCKATSNQQLQYLKAIDPSSQVISVVVRSFFHHIEVVPGLN